MRERGREQLVSSLIGDHELGPSGLIPIEQERCLPGPLVAVFDGDVSVPSGIS